MSFHSCSSPSSHTQMISDVDVFADYQLPGNEQPPDRVHTLPTFKLVSDNLDKVYAHVICELTARSKHFTFSCVLCVIIPMWPSSQTTHLSLMTIFLTIQDQEMLQKNMSCWLLVPSQSTCPSSRSWKWTWASSHSRAVWRDVCKIWSGKYLHYNWNGKNRSHWFVNILQDKGCK